MHHAEFRIVLVEDDRVFIVDPDNGSKSVTNDAEWVWEQVAAMYPARRLIYRDTSNRWDEIVPVMPDEEFGLGSVDFRPYDEHVPF
jgi:hypothetical protein